MKRSRHAAKSCQYPSRKLVWPLVLAGVAAITGCRGTLELERSDADVVLSRQLLEAPNPATRGSFGVRKLYYGSGTDEHRAVYRDPVAFRTEPVDASPFVDLGDDAEERNEYWGFTPEAFPLNARVWYPDGPGQFPLVLIVHGNHSMKDFSDPGYAYLCELLASRGFIAASIDMNFLNGGIRQENDARGWMLLQHLKAWRNFNQTESNPFYGLVDMDRIALIGHSRGGEAVAQAAAFNRLDRYPDDANIEFDFGFSIRSVVAIAPVDGQYRPADRFVPLHDVNYLVFHGSHDGDVTSFHGLRQYHRVSFTPAARGIGGVPLFKAAVYVYRANHGQWNTTWGPKDVGPRSGRILDLRGLLDPEAQREFAKIYISAFLEATLHGDSRYLPMFRDHRVIGGWLPKTMYITRFRTSGFRPLVTFAEDIDVTTGTAGGVTLLGERLSVWREGELDLRSSNERRGAATQDNQAVWLGWNRGGVDGRRWASGADAADGRSGATPDGEPMSLSAGDTIDGHDGDPAPGAPPSSYTIGLPASVAASWDVGERTSLEFLLAPTDKVPSPPGADSTAAESESEQVTAGEDDATTGEDASKAPIDLTIAVVDADGDTARLPLSRYGAIRRPLNIHILRRDGWDEERFQRLYDLVLQSYSIPLGDFVDAEPAFDPGRLRAIRFVFDRARAGTVVVDGIGLSRLDPAFTRVAIPE